jgi:hypothetical protein
MATRTTILPTASDEILFQNDGVSLCLLLNRRARTLRVVDFRSGPNPAKRIFVMSLGKREGAERVYTLVERDEVSNWARLGFQREGNIPGFYKRSDAFILGASVPREAIGDRSSESGIRPVVREVPALEEGESEVDRAYQAARRLAKERAELPQPLVRLQLARDVDVKRALASAVRSGRALTAFETFGRDVERIAFSCTARGGFSLMISVETQPCFNNAFIELLTGPRSEKEALLTASAIHSLCDELLQREIVCCFSLSPASDIELAAAYAMNGFRRTGLLNRHLLIGGRRVDAFLWSRKLALPNDG